MTHEDALQIIEQLWWIRTLLGIICGIVIGGVLSLPMHAWYRLRQLEKEQREKEQEQ